VVAGCSNTGAFSTSNGIFAENGLHQVAARIKSGLKQAGLKSN
jgi:hypothetical protein